LVEVRLQVSVAETPTSDDSRMDGLAIDVGSIIDLDTLDDINFQAGSFLGWLRAGPHLKNSK
jgi:hypothetical protein